jgi:hypothetical protein
MKLFIPEKIKVGFQERSDTYTGKLSYIIYFDQKGVLRKEKSWQSWRNKEIEPIEFDNKPIDGFVLNKGVGGSRHSYGWNARNEYIRIYDPRDFEFEISVANLLFILRENDCMRGKGLTGQYVYGWDKTELVLLPTNCEDYKQSIDFTKAQSKSVSIKDLKPGYVYKMKDLSTITYIGRHKYYGKNRSSDWRQSKSHGKVCHIFYSNGHFNELRHTKNISEELEESSEYANLVDKYYNCCYASEIDTFIVDGVESDRCQSIYDNGSNYYSSYITYYDMTIVDGKIVDKYTYLNDKNEHDVNVIERLFYLKDKNKVRLKNGKIFSIISWYIQEYCDE